ncbi:MAG TPA: hypothetical protein ACQGQJ_00960 [Xylella fastidiosa subsp. multiplex]
MHSKKRTHVNITSSKPTSLLPSFLTTTLAAYPLITSRKSTLTMTEPPTLLIL